MLVSNTFLSPNRLVSKIGCITTFTPVINASGELLLTHIVVPGKTTKINFDPMVKTGAAFSAHHEFLLHKQESNNKHWMSEECLEEIVAKRPKSISTLRDYSLYFSILPKRGLGIRLRAGPYQRLV